MTLLRGNFSMMLVVACPDDLTVEGARAALRPACDEMGLTYSVLDVDDTGGVPEPTHVLTVYGGDKPGILYRTCSMLAQDRVNITDLNSRLVGDKEPVYALILELEVPPEVNVGDLESRVRTDTAELGVDVTLREREADVL